MLNLVAGLDCVRCGSRYPADHYAEDCPKCRPHAPSNLVVAYDPSFYASREKPSTARSGLWRYGELLPVREADGISLGEGGTALHHLRRLGELLGFPRLFAKDETRNPTWSFKDRLACMAVSVAHALGARVIVSSSTGNAGAAAAAYAAKAGIPCVVFTTTGAVGPLLTQMRVYGANVIAVENKADRWVLMQHAVRALGWFPTSPFFGPVVGSNPYGIEGYKTLAYEIAEQRGWRVPDACVLPVCYGDAMLGMWRGFEEMRAFGWTDRSPRMIAAEIYGSLSAALEQETDAPPEMPSPEPTVAKSTSATRSTFQALDVIRRSGGAATVVGNETIMEWQHRLAREEGLYVEPASAAAVAALAQLREKAEIGPQDEVIVLLTASGLKDPDATAQVLGSVQVAPADRESAFSMLRELDLAAGQKPQARASCRTAPCHAR